MNDALFRALLAAAARTPRQPSIFDQLARERPCLPGDRFAQLVTEACAAGPSSAAGPAHEPAAQLTVARRTVFRPDRSSEEMMVRRPGWTPEDLVSRPNSAAAGRGSASDPRLGMPDEQLLRWSYFDLGLSEPEPGTIVRVVV